VFAHPHDPQVARLVGARNVRTGVVRAGVLADGALRVPAPGTADGPVSWCVRPEDIALGASERGPAVVLDVMHLGAVVECAVDVGDGELVVAVPTAAAPRAGQRCTPTVPADAVTIWPTHHPGAVVSGV
jgi:ABC-type sulfate/molybdate transport systems ATPase subunit